MSSDEETRPRRRSLEDTIMQRVHDWLLREGPRVDSAGSGAGSVDFASLKITIFDKDYDECDQEMVDVRFEEETVQDSSGGFLLPVED